METLDASSSFIFYMGDRCLRVSIVVFNNHANGGLGQIFRGLSTAEPVSLATGEHDPHEFDPSWLVSRQICRPQVVSEKPLSKKSSQASMPLDGLREDPCF